MSTQAAIPSLAASCAALLLAACGGGGGATASNPDPPMGEGTPPASSQGMPPSEGRPPSPSPPPREETPPEPPAPRADTATEQWARSAGIVSRANSLIASPWSVQRRVELCHVRSLDGPQRLLHRHQPGTILGRCLQLQSEHGRWSVERLTAPRQRHLAGPHGGHTGHRDGSGPQAPGGRLPHLTRVLDKGKQEKLLLCWLVALVRLRGEGRGERGWGRGRRDILLRPPVQAVWTLPWGEGEVPRSGMT